MTKTWGRAVQGGMVSVAVMAAVVLASASASAQTPDEWTARYSRLLTSAVRPSGVDYARLRAAQTEVVALHDWLATHGPGATPTAYASREAKLSYWLNAYNLTVLRGVLDLPPGTQNVLTSLPGNGFFRTRAWRLDGRTRTLDAVENQEVRPVFRDPRVHMALNCAARSCPPLRAEAYEARRVSAQLDEQVRGYLASPRAVELDAASGRLTVSQIFEWFASDFAEGAAREGWPGVFGFLRFYVPQAMRAQLESRCGAGGARCTLAYRPYDWTLNQAR